MRDGATADGGVSPEDANEAERLRAGFRDGMDADLNTSLGITALYDVLKSGASSGTKLSLIDEFDTVLSLGPVSYTHLDVYKRQPLSRFDRIARLCASLGLCFASDFFRIVVHDIPPLCAAMPPSLLLTAMVCGAGAEYSCMRCGIRKKSGGEVCRVKRSGILHCRSITNIYGTEKKSASPPIG